MNQEVKQEDSVSFEESYQRLEEILDKLSQKEVFLEDALKLYEEADRLIVFCGNKLNHAEQKIEMLIKNRKGQLEIKPFTSEVQKG